MAHSRETVGSNGFPGVANSFHLGYRRWLDGLRGLAILLVLMYHLGLVSGGFLGVDIFFVISGFLITTLLIGEWQTNGSISLKRFYSRRALRLFPALFILVIVCYICTLLFRPEEASAARQEMLVVTFYISNWNQLHQTPLYTFGHTWSLAVEEQFYIFWPIALFAMLRMRFSTRQIILAVCIGILASIAVRLVLFRMHRMARLPFFEGLPNIYRMYMGTDTRADALLVGCLVGVLASANLIPTARWLWSWTGVLTFLSLVPLSYLVITKRIDYHHFYYGVFTLVALMTAVCIVHMLAGGNRVLNAVLEFGPLVWIGRISYSLYLVQGPMIRWFPRKGYGWQHPMETLQMVGLFFAAAIVSHYCIERPFLRLKDRFKAAPPKVHTAENARPLQAAA